ncbi:MAG: hypothetical protein J6X58_03765 [Bacteroidales bacterium]|nr:hypothetical protein [Bacteroidales bacterium]
MEIIGKAFNPSNGNARAACVKTDYWVMALVTKGDDAEQTVADFTKTASSLEAEKWDQPKKLWATVQTESPVMMFCRNCINDEDGLWREFFHKNIDGIDAKQPTGASMTGLVADLKSLNPGLYIPEDFLSTYNLLSKKTVVVLSTASYERERDWDKLNEATIEAQKALCQDNPEQGWEEAGAALRNNLDPDAAYVLITDADQCRERIHWNVKQGEATDIKLWVAWSKKGWSLMNEYDEHICEVIQARTGNLIYEGFIGLHITEITDDEISFRYGKEKRVLKRGGNITFSYSDSYEDHEGTEQYDIHYSLFFKWNEDGDYSELLELNS